MDKTETAGPGPQNSDVFAAFMREPESSLDASFGGEQAPPSKPGPSRTANLLIDVELPIRILFGRTRMRLREVLTLKNGSVVELDQDAGEPVDILVNNRPIARGQVVVVDGNYGVRVTEILKQSSRSSLQDLSPDLLRLAEGVI